MQTSTTNTELTKNIEWPFVWSLIALNAAIIISWIAYHNYQPQLLNRFGFEELEWILGISKLLVMATVPPLAGFVADRLRNQNKKKIPLFSVGIGVTALLFMTVAATIAPQALLPFASILPVMLILWLISMNLFFAPALATLEEFVPAGQFAIVMGVYILVADMLYALEPAVVLLVDFLGAPLTFITGAVLVGGTGIVFQRLYKKHSLKTTSDSTEETNQCGLIALYGLAVGFAVAYVINVLPELFDIKMGDMLKFPAEFLVSGILILTAITAFVLASRIQTRLTKSMFLRVFLVSILGLVIITILPSYFSLVGVFVLVPSLAALSVMGFPLAIQKVSLRDKMLAAGIFVAGLEIPDSIMELLY